MPDKETLALLNAILNGTSAVLLVVGVVLIKQKLWRQHAIAMIGALLSSSVFLFFYLSSYYLYGDRSSGLQPGFLKSFYLFAILLPHVILATAMLPMIFMALFRAYNRSWERHKKIARPTFFIWLYVSITGVLIYWMLYHLFPSISQSTSQAGAF